MPKKLLLSMVLSLLLFACIIGNLDVARSDVMKITRYVDMDQYFDIDSGQVSLTGADLWLQEIVNEYENYSTLEYYLVPQNGAQFANLGVVDLDSISDCSVYELSSNPIDAYGGALDEVVLVVRTDIGNYAKLRVQYAYSMRAKMFALLFTIVYQNDGTPVIPKPPTEGASEPQLSLTRDLFVGVDVAHTNIDETIELAEETSSYTNLIVFGSASLTQLSWFACDEGLSFVQYSIGGGYNDSYVREVYGDCFLGKYPDDECGGRTLDQYTVGYSEHSLRFFGWVAVEDASNYHRAADRYVTGLSDHLNSIGRGSGLPFFTTDYALYWFDYKGGFGVVLAQLGSNCSKQLNIALCRGAAAMQNKDWGVLVTWKYDAPPYMESGEELYNDLILAYNNGAKYIVIYDSDAGHHQGILEPEHLQALEQFWQYAKYNPRQSTPISERVAFVLPADYAFSFRKPEDKIWGKWSDTQTSTDLYNNVNNLLETYGSKLDVIYDDGLTDENRTAYSKLIYWNDPALKPTPTPVVTLTPTPTPSPSPTATESPSPTPESKLDLFLPMETQYVIIAVIVVGVAVVAVLAVALRKRKK